ncbi:hypothetical protein TELCIR_03147, partial [Teladorsagia circumcincta]
FAKTPRTGCACELGGTPIEALRDRDSFDIDNVCANNQPTSTPSYTLDFSNYSCGFYKFNLWMLAVAMKAIPCALLLWFTVALVLKLRQTDEKRNYLYSKSFRKHIKKTTVPDRTTYMLIIMLVVFLVTELPQGFLALLNGVYTTDVNNYIYQHVGELFDLLSLVNCSVDFVLYCFMSSRYRQTFGHILIRVESWLRNQNSGCKYTKDISKTPPPTTMRPSQHTGLEITQSQDNIQ